MPRISRKPSSEALPCSTTLGSRKPPTFAPSTARASSRLPAQPSSPCRISSRRISPKRRRLDNSRIQPRRFRRPTLADVKNYFKGDRDLSARWRALKRLAVQGHDHMHELEFFQNELKTRRWSTDRPWHAVFWFGLFYGWLSDFGRSIVRPLFWWAASALSSRRSIWSAAVALGSASTAWSWAGRSLAGGALDFGAQGAALLRAGFQRQAHPALRLPLRCRNAAAGPRTAARGRLPRRSRQRDRLRHRPAHHLRRAALPPSSWPSATISGSGEGAGALLTSPPSPNPLPPGERAFSCVRHNAEPSPHAGEGRVRGRPSGPKQVSRVVRFHSSIGFPMAVPSSFSISQNERPTVLSPSGAFSPVRFT